MLELREGRMIALSKSGYREQYPDHVIIFNANIFTRSRGKIWHGDLDVTTDGDALKAMAAKEREELYVLRESDGRFENEEHRRWDAAVARVTAETVTIC